MVFSLVTRWIICALLCVGMTINGHIGYGSEPSTPQAEKPLIIQPLIARQVELAEGGMLAGQLVDSSGKPISGEAIYLANSQQILATTKTLEDGRFEIQGLRGGYYGLGSRQVCVPIQLWSTGTAPPEVAKEILLAASAGTIRSQSGISSGLLRIREALGMVAIPLLVLATAIIFQQYSGDKGGIQNAGMIPSPHP